MQPRKEEFWIRRLGRGFPGRWISLYFMRFQINLKIGLLKQFWKGGAQHPWFGCSNIVNEEKGWRWTIFETDICEILSKDKGWHKCEIVMTWQNQQNKIVTQQGKLLLGYLYDVHLHLDFIVLRMFNNNNNGLNTCCLGFLLLCLVAVPKSWLFACFVKHRVPSGVF